MAGDADRRARLAAIAQGGTAGANAYDQAQQELQARKVAAIDSMSGDTARLGGGQAQQDALTALVGDPYDLGGQVLGDASSSYAQQLGTMGSGTSGAGAGSIPVTAPAQQLPWGGFGSESTYVNAVKGKAQMAKEAAGQQTDMQRVGAENETIQNNAQQFADALAKQQAGSTMAPGTVIHGPAWTGPQPDIAPAQTPSGAAGTAAEVAAREMQRQGIGTPQPPEPDHAAAAAAGDQARNIGLSTPAAVQATGEPYLQALDALRSPLTDYQFERPAALSFGADPYATYGRFTPPTDADKLKAGQDQQQLDNYLRTGYAEPGQQRSATEAGDYLNRRQLGQQVGLTPEALGSLSNDVRMPPERITAAMGEPSWQVATQLAASASNFDDFKTQLQQKNAAAPDDQKMSPDEINLALTYFGQNLAKK